MGSLSRSSTETHANGRASRTAHCARTVVFPYPAGAVTITIGSAVARRRLTSAVLETVPERSDGTWIFDSTTSNGGAGERFSASRGLCLAVSRAGGRRVFLAVADAGD